MDLLSRPVLPADFYIAYGDDPAQFGDLWLPEGDGPFAVIVFFHGGWWKSEYDLGYAGSLCAALKQAGIAVWSVEYRRVGATGGGWPATFQDAAAGFDFISALARRYPLDLSRVIAMGHSAGAHLAFWIAGRHNVPADSEVASSIQTVPLRAAIGLAGAVDLRLVVELAGEEVFAHDRDEVYRLMGGSPETVPMRYQAGNPGDLLPFKIPQFLFQGSDDDQIPAEMPERWAKLAGADAAITMIPRTDHFDVVDPESDAWGVVLETIQRLLQT